MSFYVVIPARFASTRLPGKPLLDIAGKPMLQHVFEQAMKSKASAVVIATDDENVFAVAQSFGAQVVMTQKQHESGTDRIQEVVKLLAWPDDAIVVNVQGDEPLVPPEVINQVADNLAHHHSAGIATLAEPITQVEQLFNPNCVKVVRDYQNYALYFSRAPIAWARDHFAHDKSVLPKEFAYLRHLGIYAYRVSFLNNFVKWPLASVEKCEALEQLRALYQGVKIHVDVSAVELPAGVDTAEDLERVRDFFEKNK
jgi:3-deoxy-manno-octulosonate cytidylyltransferase (CMP-KDO synthetase)